jgi:hypothetical protein
VLNTELLSVPRVVESGYPLIMRAPVPAAVRQHRGLLRRSASGGWLWCGPDRPDRAGEAGLPRLVFLLGEDTEGPPGHPSSDSSEPTKGAGQHRTQEPDGPW